MNEHYRTNLEEIRDLAKLVGSHNAERLREYTRNMAQLKILTEKNHPGKDPPRLEG